MSEEATIDNGISRRTMLRVGAVGATGAALSAAGAFGGPYLANRGLLSPDGAFGATSMGLGDLLFYIEEFPTSPLILEPFKDPLPVPKALRPVPKSEWSTWAEPPGPGIGQQNSIGTDRHQMWIDKVGATEPVVYKIDLRVAGHSFTSSKVLPIDKKGRPTVSYDAQGKPVAAGTTRYLPLSTIYGFNGQFPGPMINAEYGRPVIVRFSNFLHENPLGLDRQDFGAPIEHVQ